MQFLKTRKQTIKVNRNGYTFQIDPDNPFVRYFGGGSGGGTSVSYVDPYKKTEIRPLLNDLSKLLRGQVGQGVTPYSGQMAAGVSPLQQTGFDTAASNMPSMATGGMQYFQDVLNQQGAGGDEYQQMAGTTLQNLMQDWDPQAETEMWEKAYKAPAMQTWQQDIMPQIMERYGEGGMGGALGRELGRSGQDLTTNLSGQLANLLYSGQQAQLGRQQTGVNQAMQMSQLPGQITGQAANIGAMGTDVLSQLLNIGGQQRGISQEQLNEPYLKWQQSQAYNNPWLTNYLSTLTGAQGQQAYGTQQQQSQLLPTLGMLGGGYLAGGGTLGGLLGLGGGTAAAGAGLGSTAALGAGGLAGTAGLTAAGGLGGAGGLAALLALSDVRRKENFAHIDNALDKVKQLDGHTYNFIHMPDRRDAGIIAQDLEKVLPEGVVEHQGIKFIKLDAVMGLLVNAINELREKVEIIGV